MRKTNWPKSSIREPATNFVRYTTRSSCIDNLLRKGHACGHDLNQNHLKRNNTSADAGPGPYGAAEPASSQDNLRIPRQSSGQRDSVFSGQGYCGLGIRRLTSSTGVPEP